MKNLLKNITATAQKGRFRLRTDAPKGDGLVEMPRKEGQEGQSLGGLKLMTIFIVVLVAHVVIFGGYAAWQMIKKNGGEMAQNPSADASSEANAPETTVPDKSEVASNGDEKGTTSPAADTNVAASAVAGGKADHVSAHIAVAPTPSAIIPAPAHAPVSASLSANQGIVDNTTVPATPASAAAYVVKGGDSLHKIAVSHHMAVARIKELNGLKDNIIHIGQKLVLSGAKPSAIPVVANANANTNMAAADIVPLATAPAPTSAVSGEGNYTVAKGDTLTKIARLHHTSAAAIMAANKLVDPKKLKIGAVLLMPVKGQGQGSSQQVTAKQTEVPAAIPSVSPANPDLVMNR